MRAAKLERALMRGGLAERGHAGEYTVWRCRNRQRRALGSMSASYGDALRAEGKLKLLRNEVALYAWAGESGELSPVPLPSPIIIGAPKPRRRARCLLVRALDEAVDARERERLSDALKRYLADAELAGNPARTTMNWQKLAIGKCEASPRADNHLPGYARARAMRRVAELHRALGDDQMQQLHWAVIQELNGADFARRCGVRPADAPKCVAGLLRALADAYDRSVRKGA